MSRNGAISSQLPTAVRTIICGFVISTLLCGCPYFSSHKLDTTPQVPVEEKYMGTWKGSITDEVYHYTTPFTMVISGKNDFEYNMNFIGFFGRKDNKKRPLIDTIKSTAFMSNVADRKFLNVKTPDRRVYIAAFIYDNDEITILPMAEEFTSFLIRKDEDLRAVLEYHFKTRLRPSYDESFCMRNMKREIPIP